MIRLSPRLLFVLFALALPGLSPAPVAATQAEAASLGLGVRDFGLEVSPADDLAPLCSPSLQLQGLADCPLSGPGGYAQRLTQAGLPYPLPPLDLQPLLPYRSLTPDAYGKIITDAAPVYRHPLEALAGFPPIRVWEKGFVFTSLIGKVTVQDQTFYQINRGEFMRAADIEEVRPSTFAGAFFSTPPTTAVGWVIHNVQLTAVPGQSPAPDAPSAGRYQFFQVLGVQFIDGFYWYLIGPDMWIHQHDVALVQPAPPPGADPTAIAVDTFEQSLGVYQNGQLIYATLISSGSRYFPTRPGTFKVWAKLTHGKMSGAYFDDRRDYYFLEDVPWILYYDGQRALHGAYWHDKFGARSSHGCVNLAPLDARWLFSYASTGMTVVIFSSQ